jgi:type VII secretion-associated serine protease mycosin
VRQPTITRWARYLVLVGFASSVVVTPTPAVAQNDGQWWHTQWEMDKVRPISDGSGITVAVLDSGVDPSVPELGGSVMSGADFTGRGEDGTVDYDPDSHGTTMAGLITGSGGSRGYLGVAPEANILPVVVSGDDAGFNESMDRYSQGIRYAVDHGASVINMSLGALPGASLESEDCPQILMDAIRYAAGNDVIVVASSGNRSGGPTEIPGRCPGVLTVGANDAQLRPWADSHRSEHVDVSAPGVGVQMIGSGGRTGTGTGTSNATALVSGAIALMRAAFPGDSADTILRRVIHTAGDIHTDGWDDATGYGVVQPYYALTEELPPDFPNPVYEGLEPGGAGPTDGSLPGASPLAPGDSALDSPDSGRGALPVLLVAILVGLVVVTTVIVIVVAVTASNKRKGRPPAGYPPQPFPPPPYQGPPHQGSPGGRR